VGFYTPTVRWAYNEDAKAPAYDADRARAMFLRARTPGRPVIIIAVNVPPFRSLGLQTAEQWREVGLDARVRLVDPADLLDLMTDPGTEWDFVLLGGGNGPDPDVLRLRFASDGLFSFSGFRSERFDEAVRRGGRYSVAVVRAAAYREAQNVLAEDLPILPLAEGLRVTVRSRRVYGLPQAEARGLVADYDFSLVKLQ
jgi:peptide/nickel transport system substrate-binding protein